MLNNGFKMIYDFRFILHSKNSIGESTFKRAEEWPHFLTVAFNI